MNINLDNNATTFIDKRVILKIKESMENVHGNPSSAHDLGKEASMRIEKSRELIMKELGITEDYGTLIFTSGATESNNIVILGLAETYEASKKCFISTLIEHPCVLNAYRALQNKKFHNIRYIKVDEYGLINKKSLETILKQHKVLLASIIYANHEIGTIQEIKELARLCHKYNTLIHIDATQAIGKIPVNLKNLEVDYASFSGHKFYGPKGIGGLFIKNTVIKPKQIIYGGNQEFFLRPGTQNVHAIEGMALALQLANKEMNDFIKCELQLKDFLISNLKKLNDKIDHFLFQPIKNY